LFDDASFHLNATSGEGQRPILGKAAGPIYALSELTDDDIRSPFFADGYFSAGAEARERKLEDGSFNIAGGRDDDDYDVPHGRFVLDLKRPGGGPTWTAFLRIMNSCFCWNTSATSTESAAFMQLCSTGNSFVHQPTRIGWSVLQLDVPRLGGVLVWNGVRCKEI